LHDIGFDDRVKTVIYAEIVAWEGERRTRSSSFVFEDRDGMSIQTYRWLYDDGGKPRFALQISHGMGEYASRYSGFAEYLTGRGFAVYANDHLGHGRTAGDIGRAGGLGLDGWNAVVEAMRQLPPRIMGEDSFPPFPIGHSWGSFLSLDHIQMWGRELQEAILSGTNGKEFTPIIGIILAKMDVIRQGPTAPKIRLNDMTFDKWGSQFIPNRTDFDWLTRDESMVDRYIEDPWCGLIASNGFFLEMFCALERMWVHASESRISKDLPILLPSGTENPVGHGTIGVNALADRFTEQGIKGIPNMFYEGGKTRDA
jgi:alpha-beta hydrolase superfamily lysophospholipase